MWMLGGIVNYETFWGRKRVRGFEKGKKVGHDTEKEVPRKKATRIDSRMWENNTQQKQMFKNTIFKTDVFYAA